MWLSIGDKYGFSADVSAKTGEDGAVLLAGVKWDGVYLEHDLAGALSGYDVVQSALDHGVLPSSVYLITSNRQGRSNTGVLLEDAGYVTKDGFVFVRHG